MQICPIGTELDVVKILHVLPGHERAESAAIRSHAGANHFHKICLGPFPKLTARSEIRSWYLSGLGAFEILPVTPATSACIDQILSVFDGRCLGNDWTRHVVIDDLRGKARQTCEQLDRSADRSN